MITMMPIVHGKKRSGWFQYIRQAFLSNMKSSPDDSPMNPSRTLMEEGRKKYSLKNVQICVPWVIIDFLILMVCEQTGEA